MTSRHDDRNESWNASRSRAFAAYPGYVNYGYFQHPENVPLFQLRMDTWYFSELEDMGRIRLGDGPIAREDGVAETLAAHMTGFRESFDGVFRLDPQDTYFGVRLDSERLAEQLDNLLPEKHTIRGIIAHFDIWAALRDEGGEVLHQWIPGVGNLWLSTQRHGPTRPSNEYPDTTRSWSAHVMLGIGSLFRSDSQQTLMHARDLWKWLRQRYPDLTCFTDAPESKGLDAEDIVITLADSPPGTPSDNRELSALNLPQLQAAVAHWERVTRHPFEWAEPFKQLG